ncbi:MAG: hypothetical protein ACYCT9_00475 [Leptospirillum sp.]|jgi:hypothetical protein
MSSKKIKVSRERRGKSRIKGRRAEEKRRGKGRGLEFLTPDSPVVFSSGPIIGA